MEIARDSPMRTCETLRCCCDHGVADVPLQQCRAAAILLTAPSATSPTGTRVKQIADTRVRRDSRCCPSPTSHLHSGCFDRAVSIEREAGRRDQERPSKPKETRRSEQPEQDHQIHEQTEREWCDFRFERPSAVVEAQRMVDVEKHGEN
jgi:hypothetical protein